MNIVATVEARMTSSRLPGKPLLMAADMTMLEHLLRRLDAVPSLSSIVLATTNNDADEPLVLLAERIGVAYFRGDEDDVLQRVVDAASSVNADLVVEITGDCPIIDPEIVEQAIRIFKAHNADYVSNVLVRSYPDGMDTQVFFLETLKRSAAMTNNPLDREHVTLHIRNHPELFSHIHLIAPPEIHWPDLGLTLDEQGDYELLKLIIEHFEGSNPMFSCLDAVRFLRQFPKLMKINQHVVRKGNA